MFFNTVQLVTYLLTGWLPTSTGFRAATRQKLSHWQHSVKMTLTDLGSAVKELQDSLQKNARSPRSRRATNGRSSLLRSARYNPQGQGQAENLGPESGFSPTSSDMRTRAISTDLLRRSISLDEGDPSAPSVDVVPHGYCVLCAEPLLDTLRMPFVAALESEGSLDNIEDETCSLVNNEAIWANIRKQREMNSPELAELPACDFNPHVVLR